MRSRAALHPTAAYLLRVAVVAIAYMVGARLGLELAFANRNVTAVWPATGIAVTTLLLYGARMWPGVAVGALVANLTNGAGLETAALITLGNTLAPLLAVTLLTRVAQLRSDLSRVRDVVALTVGGAASMTVSATLGTAALVVSGGLAAGQYWSTWPTWWIGDTMGVVLLAPFLLLLATGPGPASILDGRRLEAGALLLVLASVASLAFASRFPVPYLVFPPVVWAAVRFSRLGAAVAVLIASGIAIAATVRGGGPYVASLSETQSLFALQAFNGCLAVVALVLAAITDQAARARSALESLTDSLEAQVAERTAELTAISQAKTEYLSRMSHELRTPLSAIVGFADLLLMDESREPQRSSLDAIGKASDHLIALINDVLDISRIESGKAQIIIEPVPVAEAVAAGVELVAKTAGAAQIRIDTTAVRDASAYVSADRSYLVQALVNLLSNAVKYTPAGGSITARVEQGAGDRTRVVVTDTGPGIPAEMLPRVFEPFDRLGAERTAITGTGLGLALCRRVIEAMGGSVGVSSRLGDGSSFWLELPTASPAGAAAPPTAEGQQPAGDAQRDEVTILFVEDNATTAEMMMQVFARRPHVRVLPASRGATALELARGARPDAVLLDLHLPDMNGDEVLAQLRRDPATAEIPVIIISADATTETITGLLEAGAHSYITKPIRPRRLLAVIDAIPSRQTSSV